MTLGSNPVRQPRRRGRPRSWKHRRVASHPAGPRPPVPLASHAGRRVPRGSALRIAPAPKGRQALAPGSTRSAGRPGRACASTGWRASGGMDRRPNAGVETLARKARATRFSQFLVNEVLTNSTGYNTPARLSGLLARGPGLSRSSWETARMSARDPQAGRWSSVCRRRASVIRPSCPSTRAGHTFFRCGRSGTCRPIPDPQGAAIDALFSKFAGAF